MFKYVIREIEAVGHETLIASRRKDVVLDLLDGYGLPHIPLGGWSRNGRVGLATELLSRDLKLFGVARRFRPDVIITRNPSGAQVGMMARVKTVFDTDDGRASGIHFRTAAPFASVITTPDCIPDRYGTKHVKYPGYKETAYLHPAQFEPDPGVLDQLGVHLGEPYFILRFVAMKASHDRHESGFPVWAKSELVNLLASRGRLFVTSESPLPSEWSEFRFPLQPIEMHDAMAFSALVVGDSQTMAAEAAVLGVPNVRCSSWVGRLPYLEELEKKWRLTRGFRPASAREALALVEDWLGQLQETKEEFAARRQLMLESKLDMTKWFIDFLLGLGERH